VRLNFSPHVPGQTARPPEGVFDHLKSGLKSGMSAAELQNHVALDGGLQLIVEGYYWEAHEVLEAVWLVTAPGSREQHVVRALIQLANARLKWRMGQVQAAARISRISLNYVAEAGMGGRKEVLGLDIQQLTNCILHYNTTLEAEFAYFCSKIAL
jgi:uncharacterized protein